MYNNKKLSEELLKADGIDPAGATESERIAFIKMLEQQSRPNLRLYIGRIIINSKITKFAAAAVIIIAALIGINQFGGSTDGAGVAWAEVLEQIYNARTVTYKQTIETEELTFTSNIMLMEPSLMRSELSHGIVIIDDFSTGTMLQLMPQSKHALIQKRIGKKRPTRMFDYFEWLKNLHEQDTEFIGEDKLDGVIVNVFVCEIPFERTTVWVDPETHLPAKVKMERFPNTETANGDTVITPKMTLSFTDFGDKLKTFTSEDGETITTESSRTITISSGRGSGKGIQDRTTMTYHDFNWNAELDKSLFSMVPPEDYIVKEQTHDASEPDEDNLAYSLGFWAKFSQGKFPNAINDLGDPEKLKPLIIAKFDKDNDPEKELDAAMAEVNKILKALYFAQEKKVDGTWGYAGQAVMLGRADKIVCWWLDDQTESYKAIFGDLSIEDVTEDQLPIQP